MSASDVVKNIYTFVNILSQVRTDVVKCWDEKSLQNACNWARYCMKVEEETRGKASRIDLDRHVRVMVVMVRPLWLGPLNLEMLKDAINLLYKRLLDNPHSPVFIKKYLAEVSPDLKISSKKNFSVNHIDCLYNDLIGCNSDFISATIDNDGGVETSASVNSPFIGGAEFLSSCSVECRDLIGGGSDMTFDCTEIKAHHIFERIVTLHSGCLSCENRFLRYLEKLIESFKRFTGGYELMIEMLLTEIDCHWDHKIIEKLKQFMIRCLVSSESLEGTFWQIDVNILCRLSAADDWFLDRHVEHLLKWADNMEPVYGSSHHGDWYIWRFKGGEASTCCLTYDNLVRHVGTVLLHSNRLRMRLEPHIDNQCNMFNFSVWTDVMKCIKEGTFSNC